MARRGRAERPRARRYEVTRRDREIIYAVARMGQATTDQLCRLFFTERSVATRRLSKLVALRLLDVRVCEQSAPNIYLLTASGAALLESAGADPNELHRSRVGRHIDDHLRALNDLRVELVLAARRNVGLSVGAFHADLDLRRAAGPRPPAYVPDALVELTTPAGRLVLVVEVDTGTEGRSVFAMKVAETVQLWRSGQKCWGAAPGTWRPACFAMSEVRVRALAGAIVDRDGGALWLLAELGHVRAVGALGQIFATATEIAETPRGQAVRYAAALVPASHEVSR
ncbi:MAG: replication-relaxation family protein [Polyangiaceae bacterium]|nr:replication-relaxation family protein [Polyangiaceae bacterium]